MVRVKVRSCVVNKDVEEADALRQRSDRVKCSLKLPRPRRPLAYLESYLNFQMAKVSILRKPHKSITTAES
jgi:hypothetical protein